MGILSNFFGTSSAASKQPSSPQGPPAAAGQRSQGNVWRSVFDPGSNPNISKVGSDYYDNVKDRKSDTTTWEMILRAQDFKRRSFSDIDKDKDGFIDAKELAAALPPSAQHANTSALIEQVKPAQQGKLTRKEFNDVLDKYFLA